MFLVDENLPPSLCKLLQEMGFEAQRLSTKADSEIWRIAKQTSGVIVTKDSDFVDMTTFDRSVKIVFVATGNILNQDLLKKFRENEHRISEFITENRQVLDIT